MLVPTIYLQIVMGGDGDKRPDENIGLAVQSNRRNLVGRQFNLCIYRDAPVLFTKSSAFRTESWK